MVLTALVGLIQSILYYVVLYYVGKILTDSEDVRNFFGISSLNEKKVYFESTTRLIEKIGKILMIIAIVSIVFSVFSTITVLSRM
ncbi:hypothetical protein [Aureivirga sp. CE67]|uniref:hypothetical protein n=1 Tax=Aureivirga sp. CE67 TaxID=1788983 RepID=UPI0018CB1B99|nr:hypothetical protein [Aureivirga sp. CE67]